MTKTILLLLLTIVCTTVGAYTPTLDSLLRNGNNTDIGNNSVAANLYIKEVKNAEAENDNEIINNSAVKLIVFNENVERPKLVQVDYAGGKVSSSLVIDYSVRDFSRLSKTSGDNDNIEVQVFYSLMSSLLNNKSNHLIELFKKNNIHAKRNTELMNEDKVKLLGSYRNYLKTVKESDEENTELANPLKPEEIEQKERVDSILKESFLRADTLVKRTKEHNEFYWVIENEKIYIKFDKDHRLKTFKLITDLGNIEITCGRFVILGNQLEFPEFIWFKDLTGRKFEITARSLRMFGDSKDNHNRRLKKYQKLKENNKVSESIVKPSFLL